MKTQRNAADFVKPELFATGFDDYSTARGIANAREQFELGQTTGRETMLAGGRLTIGQNDVWGATCPKSSIQSYEKLGYHRNTRELLAGFLASGCEIVIYRNDGPYSVVYDAERQPVGVAVMSMADATAGN